MVTYEFSQFSVFPSRIESERLTFIPLHKSDISVRQMYQKYKDVSKESTKGVTFEPHTQMIEAKNFIDQSKNSFEEGESGSYIIRESDTGEWIGTTGLSPRWDRSVMESGIYLFEEYWGNGYGTERGNTFLEITFKEYDMDVWISRCAVDNEDSRNSIEKYVVGNGGEKCGYLPRMDMNTHVSDAYIYAITQEEYFSEQD